MSVTIDQLLAAVGAAGAAAAEYARVDAAREAALAAANARVAALEAELAATPPRADAGPAPVPVITASRTAVMAGLPVWVHAMDSTLGVGQPHQAVYAGALATQRASSIRCGGSTPPTFTTSRARTRSR